MSPRPAPISSAGDSPESPDRSARRSHPSGGADPTEPTDAAAPQGSTKKSGGCVFDRIRDGELAAEVILDEAEILAFLDHRPLFPGHTLVVPRRHLATLAELPPELAAALFETSRRVAAAQRDALGCQGTFLALNDVVSQSVPHVHVHVVPRTRGDGLRGFFWPRTRYASGEAPKVAARLRDALGRPGSGEAAAAGGKTAPASGEKDP